MTTYRQQWGDLTGEITQNEDNIANVQDEMLGLGRPLKVKQDQLKVKQEQLKAEHEQLKTEEKKFDDEQDELNVKLRPLDNNREALLAKYRTLAYEKDDLNLWRFTIDNSLTQMLETNYPDKEKRLSKMQSLWEEVDQVGRDELSDSGETQA